LLCIYPLALLCIPLLAIIDGLCGWARALRVPRVITAGGVSRLVMMILRRLEARLSWAFPPSLPG